MLIVIEFVLSVIVIVDGKSTVTTVASLFVIVNSTKSVVFDNSEGCVIATSKAIIELTDSKIAVNKNKDNILDFICINFSVMTVYKVYCFLEYI